MFTGIIAAVGRITQLNPLGSAGENGLRLRVEAGSLGLNDVQIGDSIAIQGACMTVIHKDEHCFEVDVSRESLSKTTGLDGLCEVNLEKALTLTERLGGHLVSGHVDGLGTIKHFNPVGESHELVIVAPTELAKYLAYKGSVVVNGVSLTVNRVEDTQEGCVFSINLIPHTVAVTTLKHLTSGKKVNLEIDLIARYVERILSLNNPVSA
jgi:riboflavin synthase